MSLARLILWSSSGLLLASMSVVALDIATHDQLNRKTDETIMLLLWGCQSTALLAVLLELRARAAEKRNVELCLRVLRLSNKPPALAINDDAEPVEVHPAYQWDCEACGRENFVRSVSYELSAEDEAQLREEHGIEPNEPGGWCTSPKKVSCAFCGASFHTVDSRAER